MSGVDFAKTDHYVRRDNVYFHEGYGGDWTFCRTLGVVEENDHIRVTIRYYADRTRLAKAVTMQYKLERTADGYRLLSCKKLSGTGLAPVYGSI